MDVAEPAPGCRCIVAAAAAAIAVLSVLVLAMGATPAGAAPFAYVTNAGVGMRGETPGDVSQYDAAGGGLVALSPAAVGSGNVPGQDFINSPYFVAVSPDGRNVYVSAVPFASIPGTLLQYSVGPDGTLKLESSAPVPPLSLPTSMVISKDGRNLYASNAGGAASVIQYSIGASGQLTLKSAPPVSSEGGRMAISPDGRSVYSTGSHEVLQYTVEPDGSLSPKSPPSVPVADGHSSFGLDVSPDGKRVYVTEDEEFGRNGLIGQFLVDSSGGLSPNTPPTVSAPGSPEDIAVSPTGGSVYATSQLLNQPVGSVFQYTVGLGGALTPKSPASVTAGMGALGIAASPNGSNVYVANGNSNSVSQFRSGADGALNPMSPTSVPAGASPIDIALGPAPLLTTLQQCRDGGWSRFGFESQGRCFAFVILTRICDFLGRHNIHPKVCPPAPPRRP